MSDLTEAQIEDVEYSAREGHIARESFYGDSVLSLIAEVRRLRSASPGTTETGTREHLCSTCKDTGSRLEPGEEMKTYCDCPIGLALGAAWGGTGNEEEAVAAIEKMRDFLRAALPVSRGPTETGTREARAIEAARQLNAHVDFSEPIVNAAGEWDFDPPYDPVPMNRAWLALGAALRDLASLPVSRGDARKTFCACHDDEAPDERGRCQTCLLPRRSPSPGSETPRGVTVERK